MDSLLATLQYSPSLMRRLHDANLREVRRLTNLLLKMKRQKGNNEGAAPSDTDLVCHDVQGNK
jgi:hypothetical protein